MPLTAQGLADAITSSEGTALNSTIQNDANLKLATAIINYLTQNGLIQVTVPANSIATIGGPASQVGPTGPVTLSGTIS